MATTVEVDGKQFELDHNYWFHVIADGKVIHRGNCGFDARYVVGRHSGISYYYDGTVHLDRRPKKT